MGQRKVGMYGGKFTPIHMGHVYSMIRASTIVDELHVIVSYDEDYERNVIFKNSKIDYIPHQVRLRWWKQITKDMPHVHVHAVEENLTGQFIDWERGAEKIKQVVGKEIDTVFSSEKGYEKYFKKLYPNAENIILDAERVTYPITGSQIRSEGVMKHWSMLPDVVKPYFAKKVVVVGTESSGKSTLVRNLANLYNTTYVEEFGRTFYERIGTYETLPEDFPDIAFEHQYHIKKELKNARKVLFVDTEAIVTQYFSIAYEGFRQPVLDEVAKLQNFDLWLYLEADVKWVSDGARVFGEEETRRKHSEILKGLLKEHGIEYISISGNYEERLKKAIHYVNELIEMDGL